MAILAKVRSLPIRKRSPKLKNGSPIRQNGVSAMEIERRKLMTASIDRISQDWISGAYKIAEQHDAKLFKAICDCENRLNAIWLACRSNNATMRQFTNELEHWEALHKTAIELAAKHKQETDNPMLFNDFPGQKL